MQQFKLDVESRALIRAAEEIMVLTRSMKDIWLFGGLDTLKQNGAEQADGARPEDVRAVAEYIQDYVKLGETEADGDPGGSRRHRRHLEGESEEGEP